MKHKSDRREDGGSNSQAELDKPAHLNLVDTWATGSFTWVGWVHYSRRFGPAEAPREVGTEMPEHILKTLTLPIVGANNGILSVPFKWFPIAIVGHGRNLVTSLWTENETTAKWVQHSGSPRIKNYEYKRPLDKFAPGFLGRSWYPPHWLSSKGPKYQRGMFSICAGAIEGYIVKENFTGISQTVRPNITTRLPLFELS